MMPTIKFQLLILFSICFCHKTVLAQKSTSGRLYKEEYYHYSIDTLKFKSPQIEIIYNLERKMGLKENVQFAGDSIFNENYNTFSILHINFSHTGKSIVIPTIPVDDVIIDDNKQLILCLSRAMVSPYNVVLYDFNGNLLFKKAITSFELVLSRKDFERFKKDFPAFFNYANTNHEINLKNNMYYIDLSYWLKLTNKDQDQIKERKWLKFSQYFPSLFSESTAHLPSYMLKNYQNFYSQTDPFYEYKFNRDGTLKTIILNNEYGGKVEIPVYKGIKVKTKE